MTFLTRPDGRIVYPRLCAHARAYALIRQTRQDASGVMKKGGFRRISAIFISPSGLVGKKAKTMPANAP